MQHLQGASPSSASRRFDNVTGVTCKLLFHALTLPRKRAFHAEFIAGLTCDGPTANMLPDTELIDKQFPWWEHNRQNWYFKRISGILLALVAVRGKAMTGTGYD